jgi:hypothetical protein
MALASWGSWFDLGCRRALCRRAAPLAPEEAPGPKDFVEHLNLSIFRHPQPPGPLLGGVSPYAAELVLVADGVAEVDLMQLTDATLPTGGLRQRKTRERITHGKPAE